jgi:hypothetical protein
MVGDKIRRGVEGICLEFKGAWNGHGFRFVMLIRNSIYPKQTCMKFESCKIGDELGRASEKLRWFEIKVTRYYFTYYLHYSFNLPNASHDN